MRGNEGSLPRNRLAFAGLKDGIAFVSTGFHLSECRARKLLGMSRASYRYEPRPDQNAELREDLAKPARHKMIRVLSLVDEFGCECLVLEVDTSLRSGSVTRELDRLFEERGRPGNVHSDSGPEFALRRILGWAEEREINLIHFKPGKYRCRIAHRQDLRTPAWRVS